VQAKRPELNKQEGETPAAPSVLFTFECYGFLFHGGQSIPGLLFQQQQQEGQYNYS